MRKYYLVLLRNTLLFVGYTSLISCSLLAPANVPTAEYVDDCALTSHPVTTWVWDELTIGTSTTVDIVEKLGIPDEEIELSSCLKVYIYAEDKIRLKAFNGILDEITISLYSDFHSDISETKEQFGDAFDGLPKTLVDARTLYGDPDVVKFDSDAFRHVVWAQIGVVADTYLNEHSQSLEQTHLLNISYFSPRAMKVFLISNPTSIEVLSCCQRRPERSKPL